MATAKTATQTKAAPTQPKLRSADEMTGYLVAAHTPFNTAVASTGSGLSWDTELRFARDLVMSGKDDRIRQCTPESLAAAMENLAHVGLTLNPIKQHCTIIARYVKETGLFEASFLPMYRGLVYLATQAGVHDIVVDVVYKADGFKVIRKSDGDHFEHEINVLTPRDGAANFFLGAYVSARMPKSSERKVEWVPAEDIFKMRDQSESYLDKDNKIRPSSPWVKWFDEQAKKSALKRASKRWEEAVIEDQRWQMFQRAVDLDHKAEGGGRVFENEAAQEPAKLLSLTEITEIEAKAKELGLHDVGKFLTKVCAAYNVGTLSEMPAKFYNEVLERIATSKKAADDKAAKAAAASKGKAK